jgi:hypothetical protein
MLGSKCDQGLLLSKLPYLEDKWQEFLSKRLVGREEKVPGFVCDVERYLPSEEKDSLHISTWYAQV